MKKRLTQVDIDNLVSTVNFLRADDSTLTVAVVELTNGCTIHGTSNVIDPVNFSEEIGRKVAFEQAKNKLWELEGYALKRDMTLLVPMAARAAHEANRVYCASLGDRSQPKWEDAPLWQRQSAILGARAIADNPDQTPEQSHESWLVHKKAEGWIWGPVKDPETKEHPCMVAYADLPESQRLKDAMFVSVVKAVLG